MLQKSVVLLFFVWVCLLPAKGYSQAVGDTTIYQTQEEQPLFPGCEKLDTTIEVIRQCASQQLLGFIYQNVRYPQEALNQKIEGTVVLTFVVEKDGTISSPKIVKDIGGGCGLEALRVVGQMNEVGVRWIPGKNKGQPVRSLFSLPVRFRIKEAPPFVVSAYRDTIYTRFDEPLDYITGQDSLAAYLDRRLKYPASGIEKCMVGNIDIQLLVFPTGEVRINDLTDYNDLGFDFWYEAIDAATSTYGKWKPAVFEGRKVTAAFDVSLAFTPTDAGCKSVTEQYTKATNLINEGADLLEKGSQAEGLAKMDEAITMFPDHAGFLLVRGQAYLDMNKLVEACADLSKARRIALVNWYDSVLPLICK